MSITVHDATPLPRFGVVAVIVNENRFLVIRRSKHVRAPQKYCFPGGGVEAGETNEEALERELLEEIGANAKIGTKLWNNVTPTGVRLSWYEATLIDKKRPLVANPAEVESIHWLCHGDLKRQPNLLSTNLEFLAALERGDFRIPTVRG